VARMGRAQAELAARLEEAEGWVLRLARARHGLERQATADARRIAAAERALAREQQRGTEQARLEVALAQERAGRLREREARDAMVAKLEERLAQAQAQAEHARAAQIEASEQANAHAEQELAGRYGEIAALTRLVGEGEDRLRRHQGEVAWLRDVWAALGRTPGWWSYVPPSWRRRWREQRLARLSLFDAQAYRAAYVDVAGAGGDALGHYIAHGMGEGRVPMPMAEGAA